MKSRATIFGLGALSAASLLSASLTANGTTLLQQVRDGSQQEALASIKSGSDVNLAESNGTTPLHWAVHNGEPALVDALIKAGANVNAINHYGASPMSEAALLGDDRIIARLLKAGANPESPNADGQTALMVVARSSNVKAAELLLKHGADVNAVEKWRGQTALIWAAAQSQPDMVKLLLDHGADPNARSYLKTGDEHRQITAERRLQWRPPGGLTALIYASREGCVACAKYLVEGGADIDQTDGEGVTALLAAVINMRFDTAKYLVEAGANVNKWSWRGENPLYAAVDVNTVPHGGYPDRPSTDDTSGIEMIRILLEAGANPNLQLKLQPVYRHLKDDRGADRMLNAGATPLLRAAKAFDIPAMELLLKAGALPNLPNRDGTTPVMAAAGLGSNKIDTRGDYATPLVGEYSSKALALLLAYGGDIHQRDNFGRTALHGAAAWGWNETVAFLAAHGADLMATDDSGLTALDNAMGKVSGAFGRGSVGDVHEDTAELLRGLMSGSPQSGAASAGL
ncbi:MAG: ankyrin repeat domain-containing protein [Gammaproteobacteria bacterium]|nr:ankyrin repeat domain-containing protein [Gammaproteobacteria bacterium]